MVEPKPLSPADDELVFFFLFFDFFAFKQVVENLPAACLGLETISQLVESRLNPDTGAARKSNPKINFILMRHSR